MCNMYIYFVLRNLIKDLYKHEFVIIMHLKVADMFIEKMKHSKIL